MSMSDDFKRALGSWASGVTVVTASDEGMHYGLTVSSFTSISLDPPLVAVCVGNHNRAPEMIRRSGRFGVSILARDQEAVSNHFARSGREPSATFEGATPHATGHDVTVVEGSLAWLACSLHQAVELGDHTLIVGEVLETRTSPDRDPLMYYRRAYRTVTS